MTLFLLNQEFKEHYKVKRTKSCRRFVIPDIHGHYDTFMALLEQIALSKNDQLFLLGDYIDRGPKVKQVLNKLLSLIENGYQVYPLRGNHEDMCWQAHLKEYDQESLKLPGYKWGKDIIDKKRKIDQKYINFISMLPYYYELDQFYLVHAGFNFSSKNPFTEYKSMLWSCNEAEDSKFLNGKILIHGHSKRSIEEIRKKVNSKAPIIGLDNSVYAKNNDAYGRLTCLNLDSFELIAQCRV